MSGFWVQCIVIYIMVAVLLAAAPWLSRKNVLFGVVFGSGDIRGNPQAKKIVGRFLWESVLLEAALAAFCVFFVSGAALEESGAVLVFTLTLLALIALQTALYIVANRAMKTIKETVFDPNLARDSITVEVGADAAREQRPVHMAWFLLLLFPVVLSALSAVYYYPAIPDPIPTHFDAAGLADGWQAKSAGVVLFPVTMQIVIAAVLFVIGIFMRKAPSSVKGNPGAAPGYSAFRRFLTYWLIGFGVIAQINFLLIVLLYAGVAVSIGVWNGVFLALVIVSVAVLIAAFVRMRRRGPQGAVYDDDVKWVGGMFYFNRSDPSLFVEKRVGIGQTLNFAHPAAWIIIGGIVALVVFSLVMAFG